jgi:magnesium transporter
MEFENPVTLPDLKIILISKDSKQLQELVSGGHPAVIAEAFPVLSPEEAGKVLKQIQQPERSEIFSHLEPDQQLDIVDLLRRDELSSLFAEMSPDDRADLFKRLPEERRESILPGLAQAEREDLRRLASYEEGTAGSVMTSDYATVLPEQTVDQAIAHLRTIAPDRETIYYAYVIDHDRRLLGFVSLKDLILARKDSRIQEIMHREVISARVDEDQEEAAAKIQRFDLLALPVINGGDSLVGIITHDDAMDILTQEYTEDVEMLMAITGSHDGGTYIRMSPWVHFRNRAPWVIILALAGLVSGFVVQRFEGLLQQFAILAVFMPMLADTGGNTGSQSATLVVRALAMKEISSRDVLRILRKELIIALLLGVMLGVIAYGRVVFFSGGAFSSETFPMYAIGFAVALALGLQVLTSTLIGSVLPLLASALKLDPALIASPAITTIVDITGLVIYFSTVKFVLGV